MVSESKAVRIENCTGFSISRSLVGASAGISLV